MSLGNVFPIAPNKLAQCYLSVGAPYLAEIAGQASPRTDYFFVILPAVFSPD